jgi:hypothetical protein
MYITPICSMGGVALPFGIAWWLAKFRELEK